MISYLASLAAGNAIELLLAPPEGATRWRVLRKRADTIAAADDAAANVVFDGDDKFFVDADSLLNGTIYYYRAFFLIGGAWVASPSRSVMCEATFRSIGTDVIDFVQERLKLGLAVYVQRGELQHPNGNEIPVLRATPEYEGAPFPLATVHLQNDAPDTRFIGEELVGDQFIAGIGDEPDSVVETEGWLGRTMLNIIVWSTNGDVRNDMRKALKSVIQANLPVFEAAGLTQIEPQFSDIDDVSTYPVPMYQTNCTITCIAPAAVQRVYGTISEVLSHVVYERTSNA